MTTIRCVLLVLLFLTGSNCRADPAWSWAPDQPIGSILPQFIAEDHLGNVRAMNELAGLNGTMLFFNRSTDW